MHLEDMIIFHSFLLTRPLRDVTTPDSAGSWFWPISTHTPLAGRDDILREKLDYMKISTHTPLAGRDCV